MRLIKTMGLVCMGCLLVGYLWWRPRDAAPVGDAANVTLHVPTKSVAAAGADVQTGFKRATNDDLVQQVREVARSRNFGVMKGLIATIVREFSGTERAELLAALGAVMAGFPIREAIELVEGTEGVRNRQALVNAALSSLINTDPRRAAELAAQLKEPVLRAGSYQGLASMWAARDPEAARAWALGLSDATARTAAVEGVASQWMQTDPKGAYTWAAGLTDLPLRDRVFLKVAKLLAGQDAKQAVDWALQFPPGLNRDEALQYSVARWADRDLTSAIKWTAQIADPASRARMEVAIANAWANNEPQGATKWASEIRDPDARAAALRSSVHRWAQADLKAAASWLATRSSGTADTLFTDVTNLLVQSQLEAAENWVANASNPSWREAGERIVAQQRSSTISK